MASTVFLGGGRFWRSSRCTCLNASCFDLNVWNITGTERRRRSIVGSAANRLSSKNGPSYYFIYESRAVSCLGGNHAMPSSSTDDANTHGDKQAD